jgi:hypothetical protein
MLGAVRIDIYELAQSVRGVHRRGESAVEVKSFPLGVQGVGIADVEVDTRRGSLRIVVRPLGQMQGDGAAIGVAVTLGACIFMDVESETPVPVEGGIKVEDRNDGSNTCECDNSHCAIVPVG